MIHRDCARMIVTTPDCCVTHVSLTGRLMPPIGWARMIVTPDNDIVAPPVKIAIQPQANREADAEGDKRRAIASLIINLVRLINRHINHLWVSRNNFNLAAVSNHLLLRRGLQVANVGSGRAQPLDGNHHILLLINKSLPQIRRPIQVVIHPFQNTWVASQSLDAGVPRLLVNLVGVTAAADVTVGQHDLRGQSGRRQDLGNQWVGIKRNWPQQLVQLLPSHRLIGGHRRWSRRLCPHGHSHAGEHAQQNRDFKQWLHLGIGRD